MRCSNVYEQKNWKGVKCDVENIEGWGWGRSFFPYLCVVATFMNNSNFGNVSSATVKILRVGVGFVNFSLIYAL